ncbi:MAG: sigma factor-like helix-turn-helix DNA-binding protein, partial [Janthinobacterium lividum]
FRLRDDDITLTLMLALERLSPLERAAFLLHDIFGMSFDEVAQSVQRDAAACRQLATRARKHVRDARPRFPVTPKRGQDIAAAFFEASRSGDMVGLRAVLADDVVAYADGGGKIAAAHKPIYGRDKVARMFVGLARKQGYQPLPLLAHGSIDGLPGFLTGDPTEMLQTTTLEIDATGVRAIYITRNPDKLRWMADFGMRQAHGAG